MDSPSNSASGIIRLKGVHDSVGNIQIMAKIIYEILTLWYSSAVSDPSSSQQQLHLMGYADFFATDTH